MFILGIIGIIVVIASVFFMVALNAKEYDARNRRQSHSVYTLNDGFDESGLTESQQRVVDYLKVQGPSKETEMIDSLQTSRVVIDRKSVV